MTGFLDRLTAHLHGEAPTVAVRPRGPFEPDPGPGPGAWPGADATGPYDDADHRPGRHAASGPWPQPAESGSVDFSLAGLGLAGPGLGGPGVTDSGVADSGVADSGVADHGLAGPGVAGSGLGGRGRVGTGLARSGLADLGLAGTDLTDVRGTGLASPGVAGPGLGGRGLTGRGLTGRRRARTRATLVNPPWRALIRVPAPRPGATTSAGRRTASRGRPCGPASHWRRTRGRPGHGPGLLSRPVPGPAGPRPRGRGRPRPASLRPRTGPPGWSCGRRTRLWRPPLPRPGRAGRPAPRPP